MIITLKLSIAKELYQTNKNLFSVADWKTTTKLSKPAERIDDLETIKIDIENRTKQEIQKLRIKLSGKVSASIIEKIDRFLEAIDNPDIVECKNIDIFKKALDAYIKSVKVRWFWTMGEDGVMLPWAINSTSIVPAQKYNPRHIALNLVRGFIESGKDCSNKSTTFNFYEWHMYEKTAAIEEDLSEDSYFDSSDEELNADDEQVVETKAKAKKSDVKRKYLSVRKILLNQAVYYHSEALQSTYISHYELWKKVQLECIGKQYICRSLGFTSSGYWSGVTSFIEDKRLQKLVVDEFIVKAGEKGMPITVSTNFGMSYLPYHFYINLYNISKHSYCTAHVSVLEEYKYNKNLLEKLIVKPAVKALVNSMIDGELEMEGKDIIEGKSGGLTILGFGPPGNGKTLTGEIYSEYVEKPLYQIQSSQLGISVNDIEKNLSAVLRRAERWNCILMIDEADTYIYKRGQDITQNCIVGTFLRLLEYYNGILFLTTNRADIIDEAIMSRVTVSIEYKNPEIDDLIKIWETHTPSYGLNIPLENITQIANKFPMSGRDVRNSLKLLSRYYKDGKPITVEKIEVIKDYLPSITI
jgi:hypothetical protein